MQVGTAIRALFSSRWAGVVCTALAVANKSLVAWLFTSLKADKALYLLFARSLLEKGVLAEPVQCIENGRRIFLFDPAVYSPFYSLLCAPVLWLTHSYVATQFIASGFAFILFFTAVAKVAALVLRERWVANIFVLCAGLFLYPFELESVVKDFFAAGFTLWSLWLLVRFFEQPPRWSTTVLLSVCLGCLCLTKLLYLPLALLLLMVLVVVVARKQRRSHLLHVLAVVLLLLAMGAAVQLFVFRPALELAATHGARLPADGTAATNGFFPENLQQTTPFLSAAIFDVDLWGVQLQKLSLSYEQTVAAFRVLDLVLLVILLACAAVFFLALRRNSALFLLALLSVAMMATVAFLSLTQKAFAFKSASAAWTWVTDVRSFFLPMLTVQLLLLGFVSGWRNHRLLRGALLALFLLQCAHGAYFSLKQAALGSFTPGANESADAVTKITKQLQSPVQQAPHTLVTSDRYLKRYAEVHNLPVYAFTGQAADLSWIPKGATYLVATHRADSSLLSVFPAGSLQAAGSAEPFVLHIYQKQ